MMEYEVQLWSNNGSGIGADCTCEQWSVEWPEGVDVFLVWQAAEGHLATHAR